MDKVTQAMVASKAAGVKQDMKKNFSDIWGDEPVEEEERIEKEKLSRTQSLQKMEEERERQRREMDARHRSMSEAREKERQRIRDKYKLKGSNKGVVEYGNVPMGSNFADNAKKLENKKDCAIQ